MSDRIDVLLFDLGGVLVDFSGVQELATLLPVAMSDRAVITRWGQCPHSHAFGTGRLTPQAFAEAFVRDWQIDLDPQRFLAEYRSWSRGLLPGANALLASLRTRYRLAALSNSNEVHWDRQTTDLGITGLFDLALSSHQLGTRKPEPAIFAAAIERLGVPPDRILFFDDAQINVDAAIDAGMHARRVDGVEGVRHALVRDGLI